MDVEIAILGGGLAGNALARQLLRTVPGAEIAVFERRTESSWKVGESTVEIASRYLTAKLELTNYLYESHLPKNGLRFFFDTPGRDAELHELSEIGSDGLALLPSFQVDRARLETDLLRFNREDGARVETGVRVRDLEVAEQPGAPHRFTVDDGGSSTRWTARWLFDASGRARLVQRALELPKLETGHDTAAVWGRFRDLVDIDRQGPESWRRRVRFTSRALSTIHFCYPGYWIWLIPLRNGITSVGVVWERSFIDQRMATEEDFWRFLRGHRAVAGLLEGASLLDMMHFGRLAYGTRRFFGTSFWGASGEAAAFTDPFYSPGTDFIALENDFLCDLVRRDRTGAAAQELAEHAGRYDAFMQLRFAATMLLYRDLYSLLGSFRLFRLKWHLDLATYYNLWLHAYLLDEHLDAGWLEVQLRQREASLGSLAEFGALFRECEAALRGAGAYHRDNTGAFLRAQDTIDFADEVGRPRSHRQIRERSEALFDQVRREAAELLGGSRAGSSSGRPAGVRAG